MNAVTAPTSSPRSARNMVRVASSARTRCPVSFKMSFLSHLVRHVVWRLSRHVFETGHPVLAGMSRYRPGLQIGVPFLGGFTCARPRPGSISRGQPALLDESEGEPCTLPLHWQAAAARSARTGHARAPRQAVRSVLLLARNIVFRTHAGGPDPPRRSRVLAVPALLPPRNRHAQPPVCNPTTADARLNHSRGGCRIADPSPGTFAALRLGGACAVDGFRFNGTGMPRTPTGPGPPVSRGCTPDSCRRCRRPGELCPRSGRCGPAWAGDRAGLPERDDDRRARLRGTAAARGQVRDLERP